jgi:hypothetical protein
MTTRFKAFGGKAKNVLNDGHTSLLLISLWLPERAMD